MYQDTQLSTPRFHFNENWLNYYDNDIRCHIKYHYCSCSKELRLLQHVDEYSHSQNLPLKNYQEVRSPCVLYNFMRYQGIQLWTYFLQFSVLIIRKEVTVLLEG